MRTQEHTLQIWKGIREMELKLGDWRARGLAVIFLTIIAMTVILKV